MNNYQWQTVGHQKIVKFLQKNIDNNKLSHAYLFSGQDNLGKFTLAREFIGSILCRDYHEKSGMPAEVLPCNNCVFCSQFEKKIHPDVYYLQKEADKKNVSVEQVREMQKILNMASFLNSYKFALIDKADSLSESAQNSLLKILEEPKPKTIIILLVSDSNLLLPTIVSRCQQVKFHPLHNNEIYDYLLKLDVKRDEANIYAALARGRIGLAVNFSQNQEIFQEYIAQADNFFKFFGKNISEQFGLLDKMLLGYEDNLEKIAYLNKELESWQLLLRDILFLQNNAEHLVVNLHFKNNLKALSRINSSSSIMSLLEKTKMIKKYLLYNINPRLAAENLILNF